jgi:hypothetical protein
VRAAEIRAAMEGAGLEIITAGGFTVSARGADGAFVQALQYPRGWRLQNAREARAATRALIARRVEDVERFCADLVQAGAR